jgi:hypothetical protein
MMLLLKAGISSGSSIILSGNGCLSIQKPGFLFSIVMLPITEGAEKYIGVFF